MFIYLIGSYDRFGKCKGLKIGVSDDPERRVRQLQTGSHDRLELVAHWMASSGSRAYSVEAEAHHKFRNHRMIGEWFYAKKLDKIIFWMNSQRECSPSFMNGDLCAAYLDLARNRERKMRRAA